MTTAALLAFAEEYERGVEEHHKQQKGGKDKNRPRSHISRLDEGKNDEDCRHGSRNGDVVKDVDGERLRRFFRQTLPVVVVGTRQGE
jgi:hypothetical protein